MIFVLGNKSLLLKSKFYEPEYNFNYPLEELDYVITKNINPDMIYVVADDKRIYETSCEKEELKDLYKELQQEMKLKSSEIAILSLCVKLYVKKGRDVANIKLKEWQENSSIHNPNIDEILKNFNTIIDPIETFKKSKKEFAVKITEEASKIVKISANSSEEALNEVIQQYNDREIVFESEDYKDMKVKAYEKINIDIPEISGTLDFAFDGIRNFEELKKSNIRDLKYEGELATIQMDNEYKNPLNVALIADQNKLILVSYLYDSYNNQIYEGKYLTSEPINIEKIKTEEELRDYMKNYFINVYKENIEFIKSYCSQEEEEEI